MASPYVSSRRHAESVWRVGLLLLIVLTATRAGYATPLRGFEGEYIIVRSDASTRIGASAASASFVFSGGSAAVQEELSHDTQVISLSPAGSAQGVLSGRERRIVDLNPKDDTCARLIADGVAKVCSPNYEVRASTIPNDPSLSSLWGLSADLGIDAPRAWDLSQGSSSVVVAVIDTGIDYNHPDLVDNMWHNPQEIAANNIDDDGNGYVDDVHGINAITGAANPGSPLDDNGHGTHVAGTIGAEGNNAVGVVGVMHDVQLMGLKFLASNGSGSTGDAIRAINYLVSMKQRGDVNVRVVNNSWGGGGFSAPLKAAIERAHDAGIIFVAAAGNSNSNNDANPSYPASYEVANVVSVAAISSSQQRASFSNYGATSVHIAAPGVGILSTTPNGNYQYLSGTSMATPHVTGALGLLLSYAPSLTNAEVIQRLFEAGREIPGLIDAGTGLPYVRTRRTLDVGRMLSNETLPLPGDYGGGETCSYAVQTSNLLLGGEIDTSADNATVVNTFDEGGYYAVDLPFDFQFFSGTVRRIYLSPNGVIYKTSPLGYDYSPADRAPLNSIAALHVDLIPRVAGQGVRVAASKDKVTIVWSSEIYSYPGMGVVTTRATLKPSGEVSVSVAFSETGAVGSLRRQVLGDPASTPVIYPSSVMGIAGPATSNAFTLNLGATLTQFGAGSSSPVFLGVTYTPLCSVRTPDQDNSPPTPGAGEGEGGDEGAAVSSLRLRRSSSGREGQRSLRFTGVMTGRGDGHFPATVYLDRQACTGSAGVTLAGGAGTFTVQVPSAVSRLGVVAAGRRASVQLPRALGTGSRLSARSHARACRSVLRSIR
jgi:subtilisin family serine protease